MKKICPDIDLVMKLGRLCCPEAQDAAFQQPAHGGARRLDHGQARTQGEARKSQVNDSQKDLKNSLKSKCSN